MAVDPEALEAQIGTHLDKGELAEAATAAIQGYGPQILGYLTALLRDEDKAGDAYSRFAEDLWRAIGRFRRECSFRTWAYRVAWSASRDVADDAFNRRGRRLESHEISAIAEAVKSSSAAYLKEAVKHRVDQLREKLAPEDQTLLILRVNRGLSWREVALVLSQPGKVLDEAAARKRFERVKDRLRELAKAEGVLE